MRMPPEPRTHCVAWLAPAWPGAWSILAPALDCGIPIAWFVATTLGVVDLGGAACARHVPGGVGGPTGVLGSGA